MNRRHNRKVNRDDGMFEEHKAVQPDLDSDLEDTNVNDKVLKVRRGGSAQEAEFDEADCESDYED